MEAVTVNTGMILEKKYARRHDTPHARKQPNCINLELSADVAVLTANTNALPEWVKWSASCSHVHLVFIDEYSAKTNMRRLYGRSRKGERCHDSAPCSWRTTTMTSSIRLDGSTECLTFEGATDKVSFGLYIEECLLPQLRDNDIVIMDNLSSHKNSFDLIKFESRNITIKYLPPYSPDFNPIEQMWSKIRASLREYRATTPDELVLTIQKAFNSLTPSDAKGWFEHCGYFQ